MVRSIRFRWKILPIACAVGTWAISTLVYAKSPETQIPRAKFPAKVTSVRGESIDVAKLAETRRVVVVTLKATWCPVCQEQLRRIRRSLRNPDQCGIAILVLSPGPAEALRQIQTDLGVPFPFIEDRNLKIASSLGLRLADDQIQPSILILERDLSVGWSRVGRSTENFGDPALLREVNCAGLI